MACKPGGLGWAATTGTATGSGTRAEPWILQTPPLTSELAAFHDETLHLPALVVIVGRTELRYQLRCLDDLQQTLEADSAWPSWSTTRATIGCAPFSGPCPALAAAIDEAAHVADQDHDDEDQHGQ